MTDELVANSMANWWENKIQNCLIVGRTKFNRFLSHAKLYLKLLLNVKH